ncbi:hypothetical protein CPHO_10875 [Corynebacterium phocae]|uniref:ABC transporter permease n=1 Tax=Corynebacterium phocae TaxID=161895 RepID=A0A1L7D6M7_9CORY|nr:hypothetical protein CPHO_10875 [Corynebacterium phocae]
MFNTFKSEFTKLRTTRSFWMTSALMVLLSCMFPAFNAAWASGPVLDTTVVAGLQVMGYALILIQAIMVVTTEYRYNVQMPLYMAQPSRLTVAVVKFVLYALIAAFLTMVALALSIAITKIFYDPQYADIYKPWETEIGRRLMWKLPLGAVLVVLFGQGLGWIVRQTAGAVSIGLIFLLGIDQLVQLIPKIGPKLIYYSPFGGLQNWISERSLPDAPWGEGIAMYGVVFLVWGLVLWGIGVALLVVRDA